MKMTKEQFEVWEQAVREAGEHYNDLIYFIDLIDNVGSHFNQDYYTQPLLFIDTVFPEFREDTRRFVRVWLGDEEIEVDEMKHL